MEKWIILFSLLLASFGIMGQEGSQPGRAQGWQLGIGFGEIPQGGSFKPSLTFGYHFNEHLYVGAIYQFKDQIQRDGRSFNARASGLAGPVSSRERVGQRMLLQGRYTPFRNGPYVSFGFVFNDNDTEHMQFAEGARTIDGVEYDGTIHIRQARPAGWGPAIGLGYQYDFKNGISLNTEWTPAWFNPIAEPAYEFSGSAGLTAEARSFLADKMTDQFQSTVTNRYKVFHFGIAYRFK